MYDVASNLPYVGRPFDIKLAMGVSGQNKVCRLTPQRLEKFSESNGLGDWGIGKGSLVERLDAMTSIIPGEMAAVAREFRDIPGMDELSGRLVPLISELCAKSRERLAQLEYLGCKKGRVGIAS